MRRRPPLLPLLAGIALLASAAPAAAQDSLPAAPVDTLAPADTLPPAAGNPRLTWLGDTLAPADTVRPHFAIVPEVFPDSLVDPYVGTRPGAWPAWTMTGDQFLGRGAFNLLDVLKSEHPVVGDELAGPGIPVFLGSPTGTFTNVQVVVDGIPVGDPLEAAWDLRRIPVEAIARVAFYPGPQVAAWGGEGTGGVLSITTRRSLAPTARSMIGFLFGIHQAESFSGTFARPITSRGAVFVAANFDDTEGYQRAGSFTRNQIVAKGSWRVLDGQTLEISRLSDGLTGEVNRSDVLGNEDQDSAILHAFYHGRFGPVIARGHWFRERHDLNENFDYQGSFPAMVGTGRRSGTTGSLEVRVGPVVAWADGGRTRDEIESTHPAFLRQDGSSLLEPPPESDPQAPVLPVPRIRTEVGGGFGVGRPGDRWAGNVSARRTSYGDAADAGTSWQAEAVGRPGSGITVRASAGRAVRAPDLVGQATLVALQADGFEIHPNLRADARALETWTGWRGEVQWTKPGWRIAGRAFGGSGGGVFLWAPPSASLYFDRGRVEDFLIGDLPFNTFDALDVSLKGQEAEVVLPLPWYDLQGRLTYRHLDAREDFSDKRLPYVPVNQALGQIRYANRLRPNRDLLIEARLTGRYVGERSSMSGETLPRYLAADLLVQATVINFTVYLATRDLANTLYRAEESYFMPGAEWDLGVVWRFRN